MTRLPRILYAVPQTLQAHLEIAKAIQTLVAPDEQPAEPSAEFAKAQSERELIGEIVRDALQILRKASPDDPEHPGWPAGTPEGRGGKFRPKDSDSASSVHATALTIHPCGTAFSLCMRSTFDDNPQCWVALQACMNTGLPTIFPGGIVGRRDR